MIAGFRIDLNRSTLGDLSLAISTETLRFGCTDQRKSVTTAGNCLLKNAITILRLCDLFHFSEDGTITLFRPHGSRVGKVKQPFGQPTAHTRRVIGFRRVPQGVLLGGGNCAFRCWAAAVGTGRFATIASSGGCMASKDS